MKKVDTESHAAPVGRRTIVKGAAWTLPAVALATSAPLASASEICAADGAVAKAIGSNQAITEIEIPACATVVRYTITGGGGGHSGTWGGSGARIEGILNLGAGPRKLKLIAGGGGLARDQPIGSAATGYANGGKGGNRYVDNQWNVDGGYGGAASAITTADGTPIIVAGGGGGANATSWEMLPKGPRYDAVAGNAGSAGFTAAGGEQGYQDLGLNIVARGGHGATLDLPGAGGIWDGQGAKPPVTGLNGTAGLVSGEGGAGQGSPSPHVNLLGCGSGGGGGGYRGGGGGATVMRYQLGPDGNFGCGGKFGKKFFFPKFPGGLSDDGAAGAGGGGGAGSSYVGGGVGITATADFLPLGNGDPADVTGLPGIVTISWS